jgi:cyclase
VSPDLVGKIGDEAFMPFAVGGGIGSLEEARLLLQAGAEKVVLNSASVHSPHLVREISEHFGSQSLVVSIDARGAMGGRYRVMTHSGKRRTPLSPPQHAKNAAGLGAGEILINSIDRDGMMGGYDLELIGGVTGAVKVPVIACGGAGRPADFVAAVEDAGASAAAAGSLFVFHGPRRGILINYPEKNELERLFSTR